MTRPDDTYYTELNAYLERKQKRTVEYRGDPAVDAIDKTLNSPPFRPPTQQEVVAELPIPKCACNRAQYVVFVWYNPELQLADWYLQMVTPVRPIPVARHCPFCGDALPTLVRKNLPEGYPAECYYECG